MYKKNIRVISFEKRNEYEIKHTDVFSAFVNIEKEFACFYIIQNKVMFYITLKSDEFEIV